MSPRLRTSSRCPSVPSPRNNTDGFGVVIIARAVPRSELLQNQEATDALELEWVKLETAK